MTQIVGFDFAELREVVLIRSDSKFCETTDCGLILVFKGLFGHNRLFFFVLLIAFLSNDVAEGVQFFFGFVNFLL